MNNMPGEWCPTQYRIVHFSSIISLSNASSFYLCAYESKYSRASDVSFHAQSYSAKSALIGRETIVHAVL